MNKIIITIEGGLIQDISGIPPDTEIEVRDWDIEIDYDRDQVALVDGEEVVVDTWISNGLIK